MKEHVTLTKRQNRLVRKLVKAKERGDITVSDKAIADLFGVSASKISHVRTNHTMPTPLSILPASKRRVLSPKTKAKIEKLVLEGKGIREIQLGAKVSYATAQRHRARLLAEQAEKTS